jgi:hypothetical protein
MAKTRMNLFHFVANVYVQPSGHDGEMTASAKLYQMKRDAKKQLAPARDEEQTKKHKVPTLRRKEKAVILKKVMGEMPTVRCLV